MKIKKSQLPYPSRVILDEDSQKPNRLAVLLKTLGFYTVPSTLYGWLDNKAYEDKRLLLMWRGITLWTYR